VNNNLREPRRSRGARIIERRNVMSFSSWLRNGKRFAPAARRRTQTASRQRTSFRPRFEALEDRALPTGALAIDSVTHVESTSGQTAFVFTVKLAQPYNKQVSVNYATRDGTATLAGGDYVKTAGTLRFARGQASQTITVLVNAATVGELDESFYVDLSHARNAYIYAVTAVGTVLTPFFTARNDSNWTYADTGAEGNVLSNDQDPSRGGLRVSAVNGSAANVGSTIQLASGALLTVNPDGAYAYNTNGAFNNLIGTGLVGDYGQLPVYVDTFTYTMTDSLGEQGTATVSIDIYDPSYMA
jgi:hypothetical protein